MVWLASHTVGAGLVAGKGKGTVLRYVSGAWYPVTICPPRTAKGAYTKPLGHLGVVPCPTHSRLPNRPTTKQGKAL